MWIASVMEIEIMTHLLSYKEGSLLLTKSISTRIYTNAFESSNNNNEDKRDYKII